MFLTFSWCHWPALHTITPAAYLSPLVTQHFCSLLLMTALGDLQEPTLPWFKDMHRLFLGCVVLSHQFSQDPCYICGNLIVTYKSVTSLSCLSVLTILIIKHAIYWVGFWLHLPSVQPDRTYDIKIGQPTVSYFLKAAAGIEKGAKKTGKMKGDIQLLAISSCQLSAVWHNIHWLYGLNLVQHVSGSTRGGVYISFL